MQAALVALIFAFSIGANPSMRVQPGTARPGDALLVTIHGSADVPEGSIGDRSLTFLPIPEGYQALSGLSIDAPIENIDVNVRLGNDADGGTVELAGQIETTTPNFPARELSVARKYLAPTAKAKKWMARDRAAFAKAFAQKVAPRLFNQNFEWPRQSLVTAPYGDLRLFNGAKQSQHYGIDLNGQVGDPVVAANDGIVVMARECYASGNSIVLHHGATLYTAYFHLAKFAVKAGAKVRQGDVLGMVGKTGRSTGPHLHWGAKINGLWVDPESLLRLDFE